MRHIRVLLAQMPPSLSTSLRHAIAQQYEMEIVDEVEGSLDLLLTAAQTDPDVVVVCLEGSELPGACHHLLAERPRTKILASSMDGRRTFLYELRPHKTVVEGDTPSKLIGTIRKAFGAVNG